MLLVPEYIYSFCLRFLALALSLTFLKSFGRNKCALAQFYGPDDTYPPSNPLSDLSDYPSDDELEMKFRHTGQDQTALTAISISYKNLYRAYCVSLYLISFVSMRLGQGFSQQKAKERSGTLTEVS